MSQREILERFDHQNLNMLAEFAQTVPTTENLCIAIYEILQRGFTHAHLEKVRIEETMMNSFEYAGGAEIGSLGSQHVKTAALGCPAGRTRQQGKGIRTYEAIARTSHADQRQL